MGVATQGMRGSLNWITQYRIYYSNDGTNFEPVTSRDGEPQVIQIFRAQFLSSRVPLSRATSFVLFGLLQR